MASIRQSLLCVLALFGASATSYALSLGRSVESARVAQLLTLSHADLVLVDAGFEAGFRQGMVCTVTRDSQRVGELLLTELRPNAATALIFDLAPGQIILPGDSVAAKTVSATK
jgi:hypothetical protein